MYKDVITAVIKRYGLKCRIIPKNEGREFYAYGFIEPLNHKSRYTSGGEFSTDGYLDGGYSLFIGEARCRTDLIGYGSEIEYDGQKYILMHGDLYYKSKQPLYSRAILKKVSGGGIDE